MQPSGHKNGPSQNSPVDALNIVLLFLRAWATSLEVFLHRDFGARYLGLQAAMVIVLIPLYCTACAGEDIRPMFGLLAAYFAMCVVNRLSSLGRNAQVAANHSFYTGYPRLMRVLPWLSEMTVKKFAEPLLVFVAGVFVCAVSPALGVYLILGAFALMGSVMAVEDAQRLRAVEMNDAVIEQQIVAERFRDLRGDRF